MGFSRAPVPLGVIFPIASGGASSYRLRKGFGVQPSTVESSLEIPRQKGTPDELFDGPDHNPVLVYKPVEGHWYIYYEQW